MTLAVPGATGFVALAQRAVIGTTDRTLGGRHPVVWPGSVYAWLCTSATLEGLARGRACWAAGQIGESAHPGQRVSAKDRRYGYRGLARTRPVIVR